MPRTRALLTPEAFGAQVVSRIMLMVGALAMQRRARRVCYFSSSAMMEGRRSARVATEFLLAIDGLDPEPVLRKGNISATGVYFSSESDVGEIGMISWLTIASSDRARSVHVMAYVVRRVRVSDANGRERVGAAFEFMPESASATAALGELVRYVVALRRDGKSAASVASRLEAQLTPAPPTVLPAVAPALAPGARPAAVSAAPPAGAGFATIPSPPPSAVVSDPSTDVGAAVAASVSASAAASASGSASASAAASGAGAGARATSDDASAHVAIDPSASATFAIGTPTGPATDVRAVTATNATVNQLTVTSMTLETSWAVTPGDSVLVDIHAPGRASRIRLEGRAIRVEEKKADPGEGQTPRYAIELEVKDETERPLQSMAPVANDSGAPPPSVPLAIQTMDDDEVSRTIDDLLSALIVPAPPPAGGAKGRGPRRTTHLSGLLSRIPLTTLCSLFEMERITGKLVVRPAGAEKPTDVYVRDGQLLDVEPLPDATTPKARLGALLALSDGSFEFYVQPVDRPDRIGVSTTALLLDLARVADESSRATT